MALNVLKKQNIELAGLDIGSAAAKLVCLKKSQGGYTLTAACHEPFPSGADADATPSQNYLDAVKACLRAGGPRSKNVVCGVSGPEVIVRGFKFPALPEQAIEQAVNMEARQVCPFDVNQSSVDFQLVQTPDSQLSGKNSKVQPRWGVMTAATNRIIRERIEYIEKAGSQTLMVDVNALALLNCLTEFTDLPQQGTVAVIDIGETLTNVVIYGRDGLPFVRDIAIAGGHVIDEIAHKLEMSKEEVLNTLIDKTDNDRRDQALLALNNAIRKMINAINETLRFYSFQDKDADVEQIYLCGGYALLETFLEFLTDALPAPVSLLNPFAQMKCSEHIDQTILQNGPMFAVAAGLAVRTL